MEFRQDFLSGKKLNDNYFITVIELLSLIF